jgi:hypothetical protein
LTKELSDTRLALARAFLPDIANQTARTNRALRLTEQRLNKLLCVPATQALIKLKEGLVSCPRTEHVTACKSRTKLVFSASPLKVVASSLCKPLKLRRVAS